MREALPLSAIVNSSTQYTYVWKGPVVNEVDGVLTLSFVAAALNGLVIYLSFFRKQVINGAYRYFLANMAAWDVAFCAALVMASLTLNLAVLLEWPVTVLACTLLISAGYAAGIGMLLALPLISSSRYLVVIKQVSRACLMCKFLRLIYGICN